VDTTGCTCLGIPCGLSEDRVEHKLQGTLNDINEWMKLNEWMNEIEWADGWMNGWMVDRSMEWNGMEWMNAFMYAVNLALLVLSIVVRCLSLLLLTNSSAVAAKPRDVRYHLEIFVTVWRLHRGQTAGRTAIVQRLVSARITLVYWSKNWTLDARERLKLYLLLNASSQVNFDKMSKYVELIFRVTIT